LRILSLLRKKRSMPTQITSIALLQTAAIGDTLLMAASIRRIRGQMPNCRVILIVGRDNAAAVDLLPPVDEVIRIQVLHPLTALRALRRIRPDILIDYGTWPRINAILTACAGAKYTVGFKTPGQARHYTYDLTADHSNERHEIENQLALLDFLGSNGKWDCSLCLPERTVGNHSVQRSYLVFHPWAGGSGKLLKEWNANRWCDVAKWANSHGFGVVITGGRDDMACSKELADSISDAVSGIHVESVAGAVNLVATAKLLKEAFAVVSVNTGTMHLAGLLGAPTVGLHGPTNPKRWAPIGPKALAITPRSGRWGYLNLGFEFDGTNDRCIDTIEANYVTGILSILLASRRKISEDTDSEHSGKAHFELK